MSRAYFVSTVSQFLDLSAEEIVGRLSKAAADRGRDSEALQVRSWADSIGDLCVGLRATELVLPDSVSWGIALEFPVPRIGRRIDCVLLSPRRVYVIEYKAGASQSASQALRQAIDYSNDLEDFHSGCKGVPVSAIALSRSFAGAADDRATDPESLGVLIQGFEEVEVKPRPPSSVTEWDAARYSAVPTIVEAATALFLNHSVEEIAHSKAGNENLEATKEAILECISTAQRDRGRHICFVSGVPGSGKTLAGLNAVTQYHKLYAGSEERTVFLSGNAPLIRVLREALRANAIAIEGVARSGRAELRRRTEAFIQDMHRFAGEEFESSHPPSESVIVFDEAQRAWSRKRNREKMSRDISEAAMVLEIMEKREDWAVIVAIIGQGQEIHEGEAGMSAWIEALGESQDWKVWSPRLDFTASLGHDRVTVRESLHLDTSRRSHTSEIAAQWVNLLLDGRVDEAAAIGRPLEAFPIYVSRDLEKCRNWLRHDSTSRRRFGLVASSGATRLRAYGVEPPTFSFLQKIQYEKWFLADSVDVRSSYQLEVAMSEFEMQGLEIDRVCLCWGGDLVWDEKLKSWRTRKFVGNLWKNVHGNDQAGADCPRTKLLNKYRVLLSRFRKDMVVFVPPGSLEDPSNCPAEFDVIADILVTCGAQKLP